MDSKEFIKIRDLLVGTEPGFNERLSKILGITERRIQNYSTDEEKGSNRPVDPAVEKLLRILVWLKEKRISNPFFSI